MDLGSIIGDMLGRIFGGAKPAQTTTVITPDTPAAAPAAAPRPAPAAPVDIEPLLDAMAAKAGQPLNWRVSIVDLMKLLDIDSSLANRKALAAELGYTADTADSAAMNIWLHKQVMTRVAAAGGKVPKSISD